MLSLLFDIEGLEGSPNISEFIDQFVVPAAEWQRRVVESELLRPYLDLSLRDGGRRYAQFIALLLRRGVCELVSEPGECVFVPLALRKKDGGLLARHRR